MPGPTYAGKYETVAHYVDRCDTAVCALLNKASRFVSLRALFRTVSRLGDGVFWYSLMAIMPLVAGKHGILIALHMGLTSLVGVLIYKQVKLQFERERPYVNNAHIDCAMPPLDRYSFPSGHTLHAVSFTAIACAYFPALAWVLVPFAILVAMSRMILGLHYPTDVLVGAGIGATIALVSFQIVGTPV